MRNLRLIAVLAAFFSWSSAQREGSLSGVAMGKMLAIVTDGGPAEQGTLALEPEPSWSVGAKRLLFMIVDFSDAPGAPVAASTVQAMMDGQVAPFYAANSYGRMTIATTVTPVLRMPMPAEWYRANSSGLAGWNVMMSDARAAAEAAGFPASDYDFDITGTPYINAGIGGISNLGVKGSWVNGRFDFYVIAHEFGHQLGFYHASAWSPLDGSPIGGGRVVEYGNYFDLMGGQADSTRHFNAWFRSLKGWFMDGETSTVSASGTYRIQAIEQPKSTGSLALKIPRDAVRDYWVEFRQAITPDQNAMNGAVVCWGYSSNQRGHLLNMGLAGGASAKGYALAIGRTFSDTDAGIHMTPVGKGGTSPETLDVVVNFGTFPGNTAPSVTVGASATAIAAGGTVTFTTAASDPDGDALAYDWDFGDGSVGPNAGSATKTFPTAGEYAVQCAVSDMKGGVGRDTVIVRVGAPATYRLSGRVTTGGSPLSGVRVSTGSYSARTDSDGTYTIVGVPSGSQTLGAVKPGWRLAAGFANPFNVSGNKTGLDFTATSVPPGPDLVPDVVGGSVTGSTLNWNCTPANFGTRDATGPVRAGIYLSTDAVITTSDVFVDSVTFQMGVPFGKAYSIYSSCTLPADLPSGSYYVGAIVDDLGAVAEMDETNNAKAYGFAVSITMPPVVDLVVDPLAVSVSGRTITISDTVRNIGAGWTTSSFTVKYYLSADATVTTADLLIGTRTVAGLAKDATSTGAIAYTAATDIAPGTYTVGVIVDATGVVPETDETNNTTAASSPISLKPDLLFSAFSASVSSGKIAVKNTLLNGGAAATAGTTTVAFYLSSDNALNTPSDLLLGTRARTSVLKVGATDGTTTSFAAPSSLSPGDYYVFAVADSKNAQSESNESNNMAGPSAKVTLKADLVVASLSASVTGRTLKITYKVKNQGPLATSGSFRVDFYLSKDQTIPTGDTLIGSRTISASVVYNATNQATTTIALPASVPAGAWRVGVVVDAGFAVPELLENNNAKASSSLTIGP